MASDDNKKELHNLKPMTAKDLSIVFKRDSKAGERFCFILGSGASRNSGIKTGREMIGEWRREILNDCDDDMNCIRRAAERMEYQPEEWEEIFQPDYQVNSKHYFVMYDLMYGDTLRAGYDYMQTAMKDAKPSIGYYCLASILDNCNNGSNLVITTNFDTLTEDALFFLSGNHPLVLGHERMASFLRSDTDRPVVAKIHRDMLLEPKSRQKEMKRLEEEWEKALRSILPNYIPIVVGYAGGDNTLMDLLKKKDLGCRKIYWCTHTSEKDLDKDVAAVIQNLKGQWVRIDGFDQLLYQMAERLKLVPNEAMLEQSYTERVNKYRDTYQEFIVPNSTPISVSKDAKSPEQALDVALAINREESRREPDLREYNQLIVRAWTLHNCSNNQEALKKLAEAIALCPDQPRAYDSRSTILHLLKRYKEALADANCAIELAPNNADYFYSRGVTLHEMMLYEEALADKDRAIELAPGNAKYYDSRGITLHEMMLYEEALADKDRAIELDPNSADYLYSRGVTLHEMMLYEEALADTNRAIELDPNNADYLYSRGVTLHEMKRYEEALADANRSIELDPSNAKYYDGRSVTLHEMKRYEEALADANRSIELDPNNAEFHAGKAVTLRDMGRLPEAKTVADHAISIAPDNAYCYGTRSRILVRMDNLKDAEKDADRAIEMDPTNPLGHFAKSEVMYERKKYVEALDSIDKALEICPNDDDYLAHRQKILNAMNPTPPDGAPALAV